MHKGGLAFTVARVCKLELDLTHRISVLSDEKTKVDLHKILKEEFLKEHYKALNKPFDLKDFNILAALWTNITLYTKRMCALIHPMVIIGIRRLKSSIFF